MDKIAISVNDRTYKVESFVFPGGELQVQIPGLPAEIDGDIVVIARLQSSESIIGLLLATEIVKRSQVGGKRFLHIPYLPFARQDRVMQHHEAFSLKVMAGIINGLGFDHVTVCDPHSDVAAAIIDRMRVINQAEIIRKHEAVKRQFWRKPNCIVVSPDAGAAKKAIAVAGILQQPLVTASKIRDVKTGAITATEVYGSVKGMCCLIVDDICDGGRTFIELAKVLKSAGADKVYLYVTHGIFSQGLGVFAGLLDGVFTTDSFLSLAVENPGQSPIPLHVSKLEL